MNETGIDPQSRPAGDSETIENLRRQINLLFGGLIVVSFTLTAYLGLQGRRAAMDMLVVQRAAEDTSKMVQQDDAAVEAGYGKLKEFARTHPDFDKQVLSRFHLNSNAATPAPKK